MSREEFKRDFLTELAFFNMICQKDLRKGFSVQQVKEELLKCTKSFYGSRIDFDFFVVKKISFITSYTSQIMNGSKLDMYLEELCDTLEVN